MFITQILQNESMFSPQNESTVQENILQRKEKKITHTFL